MGKGILLALALLFCTSLFPQSEKTIVFKSSTARSVEFGIPQDPFSSVSRLLFKSEDSLRFQEIKMPLQKGHLYFFLINEYVRVSYWIFDGDSSLRVFESPVFYPLKWMGTESGTSINDRIIQFETELKKLSRRHDRTEIGYILHQFNQKKGYYMEVARDFYKSYSDSTISATLKYYKCYRYIQQLAYKSEYLDHALSPVPLIAKNDSFSAAADFFRYRFIWGLAQLEWSREYLKKNLQVMSDREPDFRALYRTFPSRYFEDSVLGKTCMVHALLKNRRYLEKDHFLKELERLRPLAANPWTRKIIENLIRDEYYLRPGSPVSGIALYSSDGDTIDLGTFKGTPLLLDFWATWCRPCRKEEPHLKALTEEFPGLKVLKISQASEDETVKKYFRKNGIEGPNYVSYKKLADLFGVYGLPTYVLIDRDGIIYANPAPMPSDPAFREMLQHLFNE